MKGHLESRPSEKNYVPILTGPLDGIWTHSYAMLWNVSTIRRIFAMARQTISPLATKQRFR